MIKRSDSSTEAASFNRDDRFTGRAAIRKFNPLRKSLFVAMGLLSLLGLYWYFLQGLFQLNILDSLVLLLRLPGESLLNKQNTVFSGWFYEFVVFLAATLLILAFCVSWFRIRAGLGHYRLKHERGRDRSPDQLPGRQGKRSPMKKFFSIIGIIGLFFIVLNLNSQQTLTNIKLLRLRSGIPLRLTTEVTVSDDVGGFGKEGTGGSAGLISVSARPPVILLYENAEQLDDILSKAWMAWDNRNKTDFDALLRDVKGGWRRDDDTGITICINKTLSPESFPPKLNDDFPPFLLFSESFLDSCRFLGRLSGVKIRMTAIHHREPARDFQRRLSLFNTNFQTQHSSRFGEFIPEYAAFYRCVAYWQGDSLVFRDLKEEDIEQRVKELFAARRTKTIFSIPDPSVYLFPEGSAEYVAPFLDDEEDPILQYAVDVLRQVGAGSLRSDLVRMLSTKRSKGGRLLSEDSLESIAGLLVKEGEKAGLSYLIDRYGEKDEGSLRYIMVDLDMRPSRGGIDIQSQLLRRFHNARPSCLPGRMIIGQLTADMTEADARLVEKLMLSYFNSFQKLGHCAEAGAQLRFSRDGNKTTIKLDLFSDWGPLNAMGQTYWISLLKIGDEWFIEACNLISTWIS